MNIYFWSVGKAHEQYLKEGIYLFTKRLSHYFPVEWKIFSPSGNTDIEQMKKDEAAQIIRALKQDDVLVALDENGQQWLLRKLQTSYKPKQITVAGKLFF